MPGDSLLLVNKKVFFIYSSMSSFHQLHAKNNAGALVDFGTFKGNVVLVVNVARL